MAATVVMLRRWQAECIGQAQEQYQTGQSHFLCLATPGSGKTRMAALLAKKLFDKQMIDLVICFAPSVIVAEDFRTELETQTGYRMNGLIGSRGCAMTYHAMLSVEDSFWALFSLQRVFVIFDEIHHCAGHVPEAANAWGQKILCEIQGRAAYTLALTGTPWRSDRVPIALSRYCSERRQIHCDYQYGLYQSIQDRVCRISKCIVIDNDHIIVRQAQTSQQFESIKALLEDSNCTYQQLLEHEPLIAYILIQANTKLDKLRETTPQAAGLIVAASVAHAHQIALLLHKVAGEHGAVATYFDPNSHKVIQQFKSNTQKWIISVGMISEGTNIPRLRVCCYLTRVKTELYFRQVLGRILRSTSNKNENAYLYVPAEPSLRLYAERLANDIPTMEIVEFDQMTKPLGSEKEEFYSADNSLEIPTHIDTPENSEHASLSDATLMNVTLAESYESTIDVFGKFNNEILSFLSSSELSKLGNGNSRDRNTVIT